MENSEKRKKQKQQKKKKNKGFVNEALTDQLKINENGSWISSAVGSAQESAESLELLQLIIDDPPLNRMSWKMLTFLCIGSPFRVRFDPFG